MKRVLVAVAAAALVAAGTATAADAATSASNDAPLTVRVHGGALHGLATATAREFRGVRYAQPPVGALRWRMPRAEPAWSGVRDATRYGSVCPQGATTPGASPSTNEDCLFLNVTTPRTMRPGARLPVMVWWHGGGYTSDSGSIYDAQRLASQGNVIVVTINYRLGVFGYFGLPGLAGSGTFGFADQIAALRWARTNAGAFGGDGHNVTLFGQSAGGMSICAFLTSPQARGLVQQAIVQSGSCGLDWAPNVLAPGLPAATPYTDRKTNAATGAAVAADLKCRGAATLACMRALPAKALVPVSVDFANNLAYGTPLLPRDPVEAVRHGQVLRVPVLSGGARYEARAFVAGALAANPGAVTAGDYLALIKQAFGAKAAAVHAHYPLAGYASPGLAFAQLASDSGWACPTLANDAALARVTTVHGYEFADPHAPNVNGLHIPSVPTGATHATELPSLFDPLGHNLLGTDAQRRMARQMIGYWSSFARTGTPTAAGAPRWGAVHGGQRLALVPDHLHVVDAAAEHQCAFWRTVR